MKATLFEALSIASMERMHSQTLAWIMNQPEDVIPDSDKSIALKRLFRLRFPEPLTNVVAVTEQDRVDIVIQSDQIWIYIENKLKSSEHGEQLLEYINSQSCKKEVHYRPVFAYLTYINEQPSDERWLSVSCRELEASLRMLSPMQRSSEQVFLNDYLKTLRHMNLVLDCFRENHQEFPNVFSDGSKKKNDKQKYENEYMDYVRKNQLETILQKDFLNRVMDSIPGEMNYFISESRGNALVQINLGKLNVDGSTYVVGLQYQNRALKFNVASGNYKESCAEDIGRVADVVRSMIKGNMGYRRYNKPRSRAYLSLSKRLPVEVEKIDIEEFTGILHREIEGANRLLDLLRKQIMK